MHKETQLEEDGAWHSTMAEWKAEVTEDKSQVTRLGEGGPQDRGTVSCSNMQVLERSRRVGVL